MGTHFADRAGEQPFLRKLRTLNSRNGDWCDDSRYSTLQNAVEGHKVMARRFFRVASFEELETATTWGGVVKPKSKRRTVYDQLDDWDD